MDQPANPDFVTQPQCHLDDINWLGTRKRWLAYLDILGFVGLLEQSGELGAISVYEMCLDEIHGSARRNPDLGFAYFSDTFLIYAPDDSHASLGQIESATRWFFNILLLKRIPFRGALACDSLLVDKPNSIYIGNALVEAHRIGGRYNWIGLVLAPSAVLRFKELGLSMDGRLNYRSWDIPFKAKNSNQQVTESGFAYLIGASSPVDGKNQYIELLADMAKGIKSSEVRLKYENTIKFLEHFGVLPIILNSKERNALSSG